MVRAISSGNPKLGDKQKRISEETVKEESERKQEIAVLDIKTKRTELQEARVTQRKKQKHSLNQEVRTGKLTAMATVTNAHKPTALR